MLRSSAYSVFLYFGLVGVVVGLPDCPTTVVPGELDMDLANGQPRWASLQGVPKRTLTSVSCECFGRADMIVDIVGPFRFLFTCRGIWWMWRTKYRGASWSSSFIIVDINSVRG